MRYSASEKLEIIRTVERSHLSARQTLDKIGIPRTTFYRWYDRYLLDGFDGLTDRRPLAKRGTVFLTLSVNRYWIWPWMSLSCHHENCR